MAAKQLSDGNSEGTVLGQSITDKLGFFGVTTVIQPTSANAAAVVTTSATTTQLGVLLNEMRAELVSLGLIKGA